MRRRRSPGLSRISRAASRGDDGGDVLLFGRCGHGPDFVRANPLNLTAGFGRAGSIGFPARFDFAKVLPRRARVVRSRSIFFGKQNDRFSLSGTAYDAAGSLGRLNLLPGKSTCFSVGSNGVTLDVGGFSHEGERKFLADGWLFRRNRRNNAVRVV